MTPRLARRLRPLQVGVGLQGCMLWAPVEKLFQTQIGFTPASIGVMAAAYAAVVPLLEVPSGIVADRWSRSGLMVVASAAAATSALVGGLSRNVVSYIVAAMILGVYFALSSGTVDSIVYDAVVEETGDGEQYELWIGRVRMVESGAFAASALAGGLLAGWVSARLTYFVTIPFALASAVAFVRFDEPRLHRAAEPASLRSHAATTFRVMTRQPDVRRVLLLAALAALLSQALFEFGPLWLVALHAPAAAFGPYWAALIGTLGVAGYLIGKLDLADRRTLSVAAAVALGAAVMLATARSLAAVVVAQTVLALVVALLGIHAGRLLHDAVAAGVRAGVSSGVGTLSWLLFLPFSLVVGWVTRAHGVAWAGWLFAGVTGLLAVLLVVTAARTRPAPAPPATPAVDPAEDVPCRELVERATDYLDGVLPAGWQPGIGAHLAGCDGCTAYLAQLRAVIAALPAAVHSARPAPFFP